MVALQCEARPLIDHFGLRVDHDAEVFRIYRNDGVALVISGVGKVSAAAAVTYLSTQGGAGPDSGWLNCGIAGHGQWDVGEGFLAHKVTDGGGARSWYPPLIDALPCATETLITVDRPEQGFARACAYDMEAAGFYPTACRFSTSELIQCYKVVSDGPAERGAPLRARQASRLMETRLDHIASIAGQLQARAGLLAAGRAAPALLDYCAGRWRFTRTQRHQLARLCKRMQVMGLDVERTREGLRGLADARAVLRHMDRTLAATPPRLDRGVTGR